MRCFVSVLVLCAAALCGAKEYFVSNSGNDRWPGTKDKPFKTIGKAVSLVKPGDIVTVRGGTYREFVDIRKSGTPEQPIVFRGAPGETALITAGYPVYGPWTKVEGRRYIWKSEFRYAISLFFDSLLLNRYMPVESMELLDRQPGAYLHDRKTGALYVNTFSGRDPNSLRFTAVPWFGGKTEAGFSGGLTGSTPQRFSADVSRLYRWNKGIYATGSNLIIENFLVAHFPGQGIRINAPAKNVIVRNNTVYGGTCGIYFYGAVENSKILNNKVFLVAGTGIQLGGSGTKCLVKGNYVENCGTCSPWKGAPEAGSGNIFNIAHYGSFSNTDIIDNTVVVTDHERCGRTLMRNKGAIRKFTTQTGNVFYGGGVSLYATDNGSALLANNTCYHGKISIGDLRTGGQYKPVIKDNLFIEGKTDPKFADVFHRDFRLRPDSPCLGKGAFPKPGNVLYVKPGAKGDGSTPAKAADFASALSKARGGELTVYMLPGEYTGKVLLAGPVKIADHEGGAVKIRNGVFLGKGPVVIDGPVFEKCSFRLAGELKVRRSVFDGCSVQSDALSLENCTLRATALAGKTVLRNSIVSGNTCRFTAKDMISENNCFDTEAALKAFQAAVKEAHPSFFRAVKLDKNYRLPSGSDLACAGLDCSAVGGRPGAEKTQAFLLEDLKIEAVSADSAVATWSTPRHYCNVSIRSASQKGFATGFQQGGLRETTGWALLRDLVPGKPYKVNFYFYPINGDPRVSRTVEFTMPKEFKHTPATLQVDPNTPGAFRTITDALKKAGPGDTVVVAPGVYTESLVIYQSGLTLKSKVPGKARLNLAKSLNYSILVTHTKNVTVDGFQFIGLPYSAGRKAVSFNTAVNSTVRNCFFHRLGKKGVSCIQLFAYDPDGMLVENCVFDSGFHGIWIYPGKNVVIRNCSFYGNGVNAIHVGCEKGWKTEIYNNIFQDTVSNHHSPAVSVAVHGPHVYCDYNIYWKTDRAPRQGYYSFGRYRDNHVYSAVWHVMKKDILPTLDAVRARFGVEKHGIEADPLFVSIPDADFSLKPGSPAFGKGKDGKNIGADFSIFK